LIREAVATIPIHCSRFVAGLGVSGPLGPRPGISSGILPGSSSGRGGSPGSCIGGGASGFGLPGGGSVGVPGVPAGFREVRSASTSSPCDSRRDPDHPRRCPTIANLREMAAIVPGFATRQAPGSLPFDFVPALGSRSRTGSTQPTAASPTSSKSARLTAAGVDDHFLVADFIRSAGSIPSARARAPTQSIEIFFSPRSETFAIAHSGFNFMPVVTQRAVRHVAHVERRGAISATRVIGGPTRRLRCSRHRGRPRAGINGAEAGASP